MENPSQPSGFSRTCPACNSPVEGNHKFCETCGAKLDELPACPKCGARFIAPVKFCELCGAPTGLAGAGQTADPDQEVYVPEPDHHGLSTEPEYLPEPEPGPEPDYQEEYASQSGSGNPPEVEHGALREQEIRPEPEDEPEPVPDYSPLPEENSDPSPGPEPGLHEDILAPDTPPGDSPGPATVHPSPPGSKFSRKTALIVAGILILLVVAAAVYFVGLPMIRGVPSSPGTAIKSLVPAPTPSPVPTTMLVITPTAVRTTPPPAAVKTPDTSRVPLPLDSMPRNQEVFFSVQKDPVDSVITVQYQRGPGENAFSTAEVRVTYPNGKVETGYIKPSKGDAELTIQGTKSADRVEVIAKMYSGQSYRVYDDLLT